MDKPDWATRLQRTFARKYDAGFAKGLMFGKAVATRDEQDRIIKLLEEHAHPEAEADYLIECDLCERYYGVGLALALIKGENK